MLAFSRKSTDRATMTFGLLAVLLVGSLAACAQPATTAATKVKPSNVLPADTVTAPEVTPREIPKRPHESLATLLQGRASGVEVSVGPGGAISVRIRGASSFLSSTEPLYVIDGVPVSAGSGGALVGINPYEIESIRVLKNPAETALYGVRGANGVIVITTKRPSS
ncbi:MAG: TonB-dependent receptor plug domain-containing protein [Gemmatimonadales bacterium]|jgi:TonB-dependent SusC/RagA subfamily outer membrane receptor